MMGSFHHFTYLQFRAVSNIHWKNIPKTQKMRNWIELKQAILKSDFSQEALNTMRNIAREIEYFLFVFFSPEFYLVFVFIFLQTKTKFTTLWPTLHSWHVEDGQSGSGDDPPIPRSCALLCRWARCSPRPGGEAPCYTDPRPRHGDTRAHPDMGITLRRYWWWMDLTCLAAIRYTANTSFRPLILAESI